MLLKLITRPRINMLQRRTYVNIGIIPVQYKDVTDELNPPLYDIVLYNFHKARILIENELIDNVTHESKESRERHTNEIIGVLSYFEKFDQLFQFYFPIKMEDSSLEIIEAYHASYKGLIPPTNGEIRYSLAVGKDSVLGMAALTTFKSVNANIPNGGANGGIVIDPKKYAVNDLIRITRRYSMELAKKGLLGPNIHIPSPSTGVGIKELKWLTKAYFLTKADRQVHVRHMKPASPFCLKSMYKYKEMVGRSMYICLKLLTEKENYMKSCGLEPGMQGKTLIIKGLNESTEELLYRAIEDGVSCIGIQNEDGAIFNPGGIRTNNLREHLFENNSLMTYPGANAYEGKGILYEQCDILVCSGEQSINAQNVESILAKIIIEATDFAITPGAELHLQSKNVIVLPDILATNGGIIFTFLSWIRNHNNLHFEFWLRYRKGALRKILQSIEESLVRQNVNLYIDINQELNKLLTTFDVDIDILDKEFDGMIEKCVENVFEVVSKHNLGVNFRTGAYANAITNSLSELNFKYFHN